MPPENNSILMQHLKDFQKGGAALFKMRSGASPYFVNVEHMTQRNMQTGTTRSIRCKFDTPGHWTRNIHVDTILRFAEQKRVEIFGFSAADINGVYTKSDGSYKGYDEVWWKEDGTFFVARTIIDRSWALLSVDRFYSCFCEFESPLWRAMSVPPHPNNINEVLWVRFEGGGHRQLQVRPDAPAFMDIAFDVFEETSKREIEELLQRSIIHETTHTGSSKCTEFKNMKMLRRLRVENWQLWRKYVGFVRELKAGLHKYGTAPESINPLLTESVERFNKSKAVDAGANETFMFHGTSFETAVKVALEGFDFRLSKKSGYYGQGTYFASQACKSHHYTNNNETNVQMRTMIVSRVALGDIWFADKVDKDRRRPPDREGSHRPYDTVVAKPGPMPGHYQNVQTHLEAIIFGNDQAYPEFIVQYTLD